MKSLRKNLMIGVRVSAEERRRVRRAAEIVSRQRGSVVEPSVLVRELFMPKVDEILAAADTSPAQPAA